MIPIPAGIRSLPNPPAALRAALLPLALLALAAVVPVAAAQETVTITVTNTSPQIVSPPILISHGSDYVPVALGAVADPELALLAEDGDNSELATVATVQPSVLDVATAEGPLMPGASVDLTVEISDGAHYLTLLGMLVTTNDAFAFWGYDAFAMEMGSSMAPALYDGVVRVLDAGSEANTETCATIPGPPCGSAGERPMESGEGAIALHGGVLGIGDLDPAEWDWLNPVLEVSTGM